MNQVVKSEPSDLLGYIDRAAKDPTFDINKFSVLLDRQQELLRQHQLNLFNVAFSVLQSEIGQILKTGQNPTFRNPYAKLEDMDREARPVYSRNGFSIRYGTDPDPRDGWMRMTLTLAHEGGHSETSHLDGPYDLQPPGTRGTVVRSPIQAVGSTVSYLRRYLLQMVLNLVPSNDPVDDDGDATVRRKPEQQVIASDAKAELFLEDILNAKNHTELHTWHQMNERDINELFPPDKGRVNEAFKKRAQEFADAQGPGKMVR